MKINSRTPHTTLYITGRVLTVMMNHTKGSVAQQAYGVYRSERKLQHEKKVRHQLLPFATLVIFTAYSQDKMV